MAFEGFGKGALRFYEELADNNTRDWWHANKTRYEADIRAPMEFLLAELEDEFGEAKVFRPNRDTRFSADKSPYKTAAAAVIHRDAGSYYLQLSAEGLMVAGGCYMPARDQLARMRDAIADDRTGTGLADLVDQLRQTDMRVEGHDTLKTAPRGFSADHPRIELLRMKGIVAYVDHPPAGWLHTPKVRDQVVEDWHRFGPLNEWLDRNVGATQLEPTRR